MRQVRPSEVLVFGMLFIPLTCHAHSPGGALIAFGFSGVLSALLPFLDVMRISRENPRRILYAVLWTIFIAPCVFMLLTPLLYVVFFG